MKCNIVRDLLPLYFDGLCSEETTAQLEAHFEHCTECRKLKTSLSPQSTWPEDTEWEKSIAPLKKVKKKIRRKNCIICITLFFFFLFLSLVCVLTYGQINHKGISFEFVYDAVRFHFIGQQFADSNIDPLYDEIWNAYINRNEKAKILHQVYTDEEEYHQEIKQAILQKYQQYFSGKHLKYQGIYDIGYTEQNYNGRTLCIYLKFTADDNMEYYITLQKEQDGKYRIDDYFGAATVTYVSDGEEPNDNGTDTTKIFVTEDSLFSCISNNDSRRYEVQRDIVRIAGERALNGDDAFAKHGNQFSMITSNEDLQNTTYILQNNTRKKLSAIMKLEYYPTDFTSEVIDYDRSQHLFRNRVTLEFTGKESKNKALLTLECYQVADRFVLIENSAKVYGEELPDTVAHKLENLFSDKK